MSGNDSYGARAEARVPTSAGADAASREVGSCSGRGAELAREFLRWQRDQRRRTPATVYAYQRVLGSLLDAIGGTSLDAVTVVQLERWLDRPRPGRAHGNVGAAATIAREVALVRTFYKWLFARGHVERNPTAMLVAPTVRNTHPKPLSDEVWRALWFAPLDDVERVFLGLGFFCGLRRREMVELKSYNVDLAREQFVHFKRKGGGTDVVPYGRMVQVFEKKMPHLLGERESFLTLLREAADARAGMWLIAWADGWISPPRARKLAELEPGQLDPQHLNRKLDAICEKVGIPHVTPHQLRHSTATNLLRAGVPLAMVSRLMNHSSIQTTMRYVKSGADELGEWLTRETNEIGRGTSSLEGETGREEGERWE